MNLMTVRYLVHFQSIYYPGLQKHIIGFFVVDSYHGYMIPLCFALLEDVLISKSPVPLVLLWHSFCSLGNSPRHTVLILILTKGSSFWSCVRLSLLRTYDSTMFRKLTLWIFWFMYWSWFSPSAHYIDLEPDKPYWILVAVKCLANLFLDLLNHIVIWFSPLCWSCARRS